jgi:hypothetical protein
MGIPGFAIALLKLFGSPFTAEPLRIQGTGPCLRQPLAILHGLADTLVPPQQWDPHGSDGAYAAIASPGKALFFAGSNPQHKLPSGLQATLRAGRGCSYRERVVVAASSAQSEPKAWADMHNSSTAECSSPSSIAVGMWSPG